MARIRTIKPAFFMDEDVAELDPITRLLYIGLWTIADGHGKLADRPKRIKAEVFPYDAIDADEHLQILHDAGFIVRYVVDGQSYILIPKFRKHQRITGNEATTASEFPDPERLNAPMLSAETNGKQSGNSLETANVLEGKGKEGKGRESARSLVSFPIVSPLPSEDANAPPDESEPIPFRDFMAVYPVKTGRLAGLKEFRKRYPSIDKQAAALGAIRSQVSAGVKITEEARWWIREGREADPLPESAQPIQETKHKRFD